MGISFGSINTGLPKNIVQQLVEAERIPIQKLEGRKAKIANKKALVGQLTGLVQGLRTDLRANSSSKMLREVTVNTRDDLVSVDVDKNIVQPGIHQIEIVSLAKRSTGTSNGFEDPNNVYTGVGYIRYSLPNGEEKDVFIGPENASLNGIASVINSDPANGLNAVVINDGSGDEAPWRLNLSLTESGDENKVEWPYFYLIDGDDDLYIENEQKAKDARIKLNGFEFEVASNKLKSIIPGAVVTLKRPAPGEEFAIEITEDSAKVTDKVKGLTDKINAVISFINEQNRLTESSDTSQTLGGDIMLQTIESRLRNSVFTPVKTPIGDVRAADYGISFQKDGTLTFDTKTFEKKTSEDYRKLSMFMTGFMDEEGEQVQGFIKNLMTVADQLVSYPAGLLKSKEGTLDSNIRRIDRNIAQKERFLAQKEKNLKRKFSRLESTISNIKNQGAGLGSIGAGGASPVQQLG